MNRRQQLKKWIPFLGEGPTGFNEILTELSWVYDDLHVLGGKTILELGPGRRLQFLSFLKAHAPSAALSAVGKTAHKGGGKQQLQSGIPHHDMFILPYLKQLDKNSVDLIYSRHVLEMHSIDARLLLKDPHFKSAIQNNSFHDLPEEFPASQKNILAIFMECYRCLRPGGVLITQVAKKKYAVLNQSGLESFSPAKLRFRDLGRFSQISTLVK